MLKLKERSTSSGAGAAEVPTARAPRRAVAMKLKEGIVDVVDGGVFSFGNWSSQLLVEVNREVEGMEVVCKEWRLSWLMSGISRREYLLYILYTAMACGQARHRWSKDKEKL
jgi:hypothetical protein